MAIEDNIHGRWRFGDDGLVDFYGVNNLTANGTVTFTATGGYLNSGFTSVLDDTNNLVVPNPSQFNGLTAWACLFAFRRTAFDSGKACFTCGGAALANGIVSYPMKSNGGNGNRLFSIRHGGDVAEFEITDLYPGANTWGVILINVRATNSCEVWRNGNAKVTSTANLSMNATITALRFGNLYSGAGQPWGGNLSHAALWKRALTDDEAAMVVSELDWSAGHGLPTAFDASPSMPMAQSLDYSPASAGMHRIRL